MTFVHHVSQKSLLELEAFVARPEEVDGQLVWTRPEWLELLMATPANLPPEEGSR